MKRIIEVVMFIMFMITSPILANDIYVTQSGASLTLDILQDGENNTIGNSTTSSAPTGATTSLNIDQAVIRMSSLIKLMVRHIQVLLTYKVTQMMLI